MLLRAVMAVTAVRPFVGYACILIIIIIIIIIAVCFSVLKRMQSVKSSQPLIILLKVNVKHL